MNYSDKFGATSFQEVSSPFAKGDFDISIPGNTAAQPTPSGFIKINDAELLFSGNYKREGSDLVISNDVRKLVVPDYFKGEVRPTLSSRDGATLSGNVIEALTGHVSYAQASGAPEPPKEIGSVAKLTGSATAIRNGVAVELNIGDKVYKGDVLQSGQGASLGITFIDGTAFSLSSNARMVLNEMVYDPNGSSNSSLLSLVQGTITFVAGQTAKNGNMRVDTPVATMGIRGTAVLVEIGADNGPTKFSVLVEPGNKVGSFNLYDKTTGALLGSVSQAGQVTLVTPGGIGQQATAVELPKTIIDLQNERALIKQVFEMFFPNYNDANPQGTNGIGSSVNNLANYLNGLIKVDPGTTLFKQDVNFLGLSGPVTVTATAVTTPPPIIITDATDIQPPEERGGQFKIADQIVPDSRIIPYIAGSGRLDTAEGPGSMPPGFPLRDLITFNPQTGEITYNPADFRFLADGEQAIYTFSFQSQSDEFIFTKTLTLTIDGLNDAPIFTVENFAAPVVEPGSTDSAGTFSKQGTLTFTDLDFSDVASGYTVQTLGVTATGTTTAVPNTAALLGFLNLNGVTKAVGSTQGVITQTFSAPASAFDYLAAGETVNLAYQISVTDADGASRTSTLTVTVTGTNDTPTITGATTPASTSGDLSEDGVLTASGVITFRDVDLSNTHTAVSALTSGTISTPLPGFNPATSMLGSLAVTVNENPNDANNIGTVSWIYSLDNLIAQRLAEGQVVTQTFTVTITDSSGATVTQPVTVTITGANDVPEIVLSSPNVNDPVTIDTGAVTEEADVNVDGDISATGIVVFKDVDLSDTHTASAVLKSADATVDLPGFSEGVVGVAASVDSVGTFTLDTGLIGDNTDLIDIGVVGWTFTVDNDHPVVQSLAAGQTITQVYTITITDSSGAAVTKDVTVTITGTNDAPTVNAAVVEILGEPTDASALSASIAVDFGDVDLIDTGHSATILGVSPTGPLGGLSEGDLLALVSPGTVTKASGSQNGTFNLEFNAAAGTFDYLADGETLTLIYGVQIDDGDGGKVNQSVTITITGSNDAPTIAVVDVSGAVQEEGPTQLGYLNDTGSVTFADADLTDQVAATVSFVDAVASAGATITGPLHSALMSAMTLQQTSGNTGTVNWSFDVLHHLIQYLGEDETITVTYQIVVQDDSETATSTSAPQTVTVTITGTNDLPVVVGAADASASEPTDGDPVEATGNIGFVDADLSDRPVVTASFASLVYTNAQGADATLSLSPAQMTALAAELAIVPDPGNHHNGGASWTYSVPSSAVDFLAVGEQLVLTYTLSVDDDHGTLVTRDVTVTITGTNDAPVITSNGGAPLTVSVDENTTAVATVTATDADRDATIEYSIVNGPGSPDWAQFTIDPETGELSFITAPDYEAPADSNGDNSYVVQVRAFDGTHEDIQTITVNVTDEAEGNSAPNAVDDTIVLRNDFFAVASTLTGNDTDPDAGDTVTISGLSHGATLAEEIPGGFKVQGLYGTLYVYSGNATNPIGGSINAGDYFFYLGQDINGDPIANNLADILQPDALLSDSFTYTVSDGHGGFDDANISLTIEPSPVHVTVLSSGGVDVTPARLWSYLNDNDLVAISSSGLTIHVPDESGSGMTIVTVDAQDLTYTPPNPNLPIEDVALTGGYIKSVHVAYDADGPGGNGAIDLYSATNFNIPAETFYAAVMAQTPTSFEALLATYAYLSNGNTGPDTLFGGDRGDVIDTGGNPTAQVGDTVHAGGGNDVILIHDDNSWNIDGGEGIDTIRFVGEIHTGQVPPGSDAHNIEIIDLNTTHADTLLIDGEGAASINDDATLHVLGNASDLVNFENSDAYPDHYWHHAEVSGESGFELYQFTTGIGPNVNVAAEVFVQDGIGVNFAPMLSGDEISVIESQNDGVTIVLDLMLTDYYEAGALTITAEAMHGSVTAVIGGEPTSLDPDDGGVAGVLADINAVFASGVTYTPINYNEQSPTNINDIVTVKVTDSHGLSDTLNFVFHQSGPGGVTLVGTGGKDLIFSTDGNDTLTGDPTSYQTARDNFVFAPGNGQDSIEDFQTGIDRIDLRQFAGEVDAGTIDDWLINHASPSGANTLIAFDESNSILVKNVAALTANDFILHPGGGGNPYA